MSVLEIVFFAICALFVLGGGLATIAARRPVRAAMGLLSTILGVAGCYLLLNAQFLAAVQVIVYAGAVVILFIFVVMLLGPAGELKGEFGAAIPRYVGAGLFLLGSAGVLILVIELAGDWTVALPALPQGYGEIESVGREVFTDKIVPFELTGALLLVAVIGALAVARGKHVDPTRYPDKRLPPGPTDAGGPEAAS